VRIVLGALFAGLALAACGGSSSSSGSSSDWKNLSSVHVTVAQPGLPPPYGRPKTTAFTTSAQVARATKLLNAHHIKQAASTTSSSGCAGGFKIAIAIVPRTSGTVNLNAYRCAGQTTGNTDGDLVAFLQALGYKIS
jgi:hypothetical protein